MDPASSRPPARSPTPPAYPPTHAGLCWIFTKAMGIKPLRAMTRVAWWYNW